MEEIPKISLLTYVLSLVFVSFISGYGIYYWQQSVIKKIPKNPQVILTTPTITPTPSKRISFTDEILEYLFQRDQLCDLQFNTSDSEVQWLDYSDNEISFKYPYSLKWGDQQFFIPKTNKDSEGVLNFGPMATRVEGCAAIRVYQLTTLNNTSLTKIKTSLPATETKMTSINSYPALEYIQTPGMASLEGVYLQNSKNVYFFNTRLGRLNSPEFKKIISSIRFK